MKRNVMLLLIFLPVFLQAQNLGLRLDAGIGAGLTFGTLKSYGISAATKPKMTIGPNITAGFRFEGDALFGGKISEEAEDLSIGMTTRSAMLAKGEYYLGKSNTRPYVGYYLVIQFGFRIFGIHDREKE